LVIMALAAEIAGTDDPTHIAAHINGVTPRGHRMHDLPGVQDLVANGEDIDYDGPSGPQEFSQPGELTAASFAIISYGEDNRIDDSATEFRQASF
jgi:hypothetical protein